MVRFQKLARKLVPGGSDTIAAKEYYLASSIRYIVSYRDPIAPTYLSYFK